jgi:hypothetical protein
MEKIRFAFYRAQFQSVWDDVIAAWTGVFNPFTPPYSHVEIGFFIDGRWKYFSSASRNADGSNGTRWIDGDILLKNSKNWDVYELTAPRPISEMIKTANNILGCKYDWWGIAAFATIFGQLNEKTKWYCSESCHYIFFGLWKKRVSPRGLFTEIKSSKPRLVF